MLQRKKKQTNIEPVYRGGIKIFKALAKLASNSKFLLAKSEKNSPKSCLCRAFVQCALAGKKTYREEEKSTRQAGE
jgi:hypothetical protein